VGLGEQRPPVLRGRHRVGGDKEVAQLVVLGAEPANLSDERASPGGHCALQRGCESTRPRMRSKPSRSAAPPAVGAWARAYEAAISVVRGYLAVWREQGRAAASDQFLVPSERGGGNDEALPDVLRDSP
jgi:hypothetical protein